MRIRIFRVLRVTVVVFAVLFTASWLRNNFMALRSEQAVINAEIMQLRSPIDGILEMGSARPGTLLKKGDVVFTVVNPRFGDRESVSQYNGLQNMVENIRSELLGAGHTRDLAQIDVDHANRLYALKLIPRIEMEQANAKLEIAKNLVEDRQKLLGRSMQRAEEMGRQMELQKQSEVRMPEDGLVWSIEGKSGELMENNKLVMEVINPSRMWVDAFFSERHAHELKTGLPASIRSLDSQLQWPGHLQSIRAGVGRLSYDTTVAVPPPEMAKRQIGVRIEAEWAQPFGPSEFFGVGRSVEVSFDKVPQVKTVGDQWRENALAFWSRKLNGAQDRAEVTR
jgi:multidrug resistance efflux pump